MLRNQKLIYKSLSALILFLILSFVELRSPGVAQAQDFYVDSNLYYEVKEDGKTHAEINVQIENATSERLAKKYLLNLLNFEPTNIKIIDDHGNELSYKELRKEGNSILEIEFQNPQAGRGRKNGFTIYFETYTLAEKIGDTWEISIPKLEKDDAIREYVINIKVPNALGDQAFVSPKPSDTIQYDNSKLYRYEKNKILAGNINLVFGKFQTYSFELRYHLENPVDQTTEVDLAIPPDTGYQSVLYDDIFPKPDSVVLDKDGNWLAKYQLPPREKLDVQLKGVVKIYSFYRDGIQDISPSNLLANTRSTKYWDTKDPSIRDLASKLDTPEAIYNYVVSSLTYDYSKTNTDTDRLGAVKALEFKNNALCTEFTDLFIAIARASGIPAREINGYAYSKNPRIQPLSLVADVLHAWPEYWDQQEQKWIPVDPTWESTTGGRDYFNSFDVNHFTFVIHGKSDTMPYPPASYKLGPEPQKDILIEPADVSLDASENITIETNIDYNSLSGYIPLTITIKNQGKGALYDKNVYLYRDEDLMKTYTVDQILPYGEHVIDENINYGLFARNAPDNLKVVVGDAESVINTKKEDVLVLHLLLILGLISALLFLVYLKLKPEFRFNMVFKPKKIKEKYRNWYKKIKHRNEPIYQNNEE